MIVSFVEQFEENLNCFDFYVIYFAEINDILADIPGGKVGKSKQSKNRKQKSVHFNQKVEIIV